MQGDGRWQIGPGERFLRSRLVVRAESSRHVWMELAQPKIKTNYGQALEDFSMGNMAHTLHYLLKLMDRMQLCGPS